MATKTLGIVFPIKMGEHWNLDESAVYAPIKVGGDVIGFISGIDEKKGCAIGQIWAANLGVEYNSDDEEEREIIGINLKVPSQTMVVFPDDISGDMDFGYEGI